MRIRGPKTPETVDAVGVQPTASKPFVLFGGGEGSRTPVRKRFHRNLSERRRSFAFPYSGVGRHTTGLGRVMMRGTVNSFRTHGHHSDDAPARLVVLPGGTAALSRGENYVIVVL